MRDRPPCHTKDFFPTKHSIAHQPSANYYLGYIGNSRAKSDFATLESYGTYSNTILYSSITISCTSAHKQLHYLEEFG